MSIDGNFDGEKCSHLLVVVVEAVVEVVGVVVVAAVVEVVGVVVVEAVVVVAGVVVATAATRNK